MLNVAKIKAKLKPKKFLPSFPLDPSCNSWAFFGDQGSGKTLGAMALALQLAIKRRRGIVSNLAISPEGVYAYGHKYKIDWLKRIADEGQVVNLPSNYDLDLLFRYPRSIVIFDEAGALMFSRNFQNNNKTIIEAGIQLRKNLTNLIWTAQYPEQSDKFMRETVERCVWCDGVQFFNRSLQIDVALFRSERHFVSKHFWAWVDNPELRLKHVKTALRSLGSVKRFVNQRDLYVLGCFDSHSIVGSVVARPLQPIIQSYEYRTDLPRGYYLNRVRIVYGDRLKEWDDPLTNYTYRLTPPRESEILEYLNNDYGFLMPPPPSNYQAIACILPGYFPADQPLPPYTGFDKNNSSKVSSINRGKQSKPIKQSIKNKPKTITL